MAGRRGREAAQTAPGPELRLASSRRGQGVGVSFRVRLRRAARAAQRALDRLLGASGARAGGGICGLAKDTRCMLDASFGHIVANTVSGAPLRAMAPRGHIARGRT